MANRGRFPLLVDIKVTEKNVFGVRSGSCRWGTHFVLVKMVATSAEGREAEMLVKAARLVWSKLARLRD